MQLRERRYVIARRFPNAQSLESLTSLPEPPKIGRSGRPSEAIQESPDCVESVPHDVLR